MNETFIEDSQNKIDQEDGQNQQKPQPFEGSLKGLGRALETRADRGRQEIPGHFVDGADGIAQGHARLEVKGKGHRRELAGMVDRERPHAHRYFGDGVDGHQLVLGGADIQQGQGRRVFLVLGFQFHNDLIGIVGRIDGGNLP